MAKCQKCISDLGNAHEPTNRDWRVLLRACLPAGTDIIGFINGCKLEGDRVLSDAENQTNIENIVMQLNVYFPVQDFYNQTKGR